MSFVLEVTGLTAIVREDRRDERREESLTETCGEVGELSCKVPAVPGRLASVVSTMSCARAIGSGPSGEA